MTETRSIKQHYVPQFLLKNFSNNKKVMVFDKKTERIEQKSIRSVCSRDYFYDITLDDLLENEPILKDALSKHLYKNSIEDTEMLIKKCFFSCDESITQIEAKSGEIIKKILNHETLCVLSEEERSTLCSFVAVQILRTEADQIYMREITDKIKEISHEIVIRQGKTEEEFSEWANKEFGKDITLKMKFLALVNLQQNSFEQACVLSQKKIFLIKNLTNRPFYISDNPVVRWNNNHFGIIGNLGLLCRGIEIYLSLSDKITLAFHCPSLVPPINVFASMDTPEYRKYEAMEYGDCLAGMPENVRFLNHLQVGFSNRYIISSEPCFELAQEMIKNDPKYKGYYYKPIIS